jgi:hypothetical protein
MRIFKRGDKPATVTENASVLGDSFFDHLLRQQQSRKSDLRNPFTGDPFDPSERYLSARSAALARAMRCPVRVHTSRNCAKPPQARKAHRPTATSRRGLPCIRSAEFGGCGARPSLPEDRIGGRLTKEVRAPAQPVIADFCNKICHKQTSISDPPLQLG